MARPIWQRVTGRVNAQSIIKKTGAAIVAGELLALDNDSYNLFAAATDKLVYGIALDAAASSSVAEIRVDRLGPNDVVRAKVASGTASASNKGEFVDIASSTTGITLTESNNDAVVVAFPEAGYLDICFGDNAAYPTPTTTVSD